MRSFPTPGLRGSDLLADLTAVLERARERGLVGPGDLWGHLDHARGYAGAVGGPVVGLCVDLGSGAGLPGLVMALEWGESRWCLVDRRHRSTVFLEEAVESLELGLRVRVIESAAEALGREGRMRAAASLVVARGFGRPAVVAECAAPLLAPGGRLVVSEPPESSGERWDAEAMAGLGLGPAEVVESAGYGYALVEQLHACPDRYPRRSPAKRPLW